MHNTWLILRLAWSAVVTAYFVLAIVASKRLRGGEKKLNHAILIVMAVLIAIRIAVRHFLGGFVYRLAEVIVGIAAGVAALIVAKMLTSQTPGDDAEAAGSKDRIQSLKLS